MEVTGIWGSGGYRMVERQVGGGQGVHIQDKTPILLSHTIRSSKSRALCALGK